MPRKPESVSFTKWFREHVGTGISSIHEMRDLMKKLRDTGVGRTFGDERKIREAYNRATPFYNKLLLFPFIKPAADYVFSHVRLNGRMNVLSLQSGLSYLENFIAKHRIPEGKVISFDLSDRMNEQGKMLSRKEGVNNIQFITGTSSIIPVKAGTQDTILLISPHIHEQAQLSQTVKEMRRVIKNRQQSRVIYINQAESREELESSFSAFTQNGFDVIHSQIAAFQQIGKNVLMLTARPKT